MVIFFIMLIANMSVVSRKGNMNSENSIIKRTTENGELRMDIINGCKIYRR